CRLPSPQSARSCAAASRHAPRGTPTEALPPSRTSRPSCRRRRAAPRSGFPSALARHELRRPTDGRSAPRCIAARSRRARSRLARPGRTRCSRRVRGRRSSRAPGDTRGAAAAALDALPVRAKQALEKLLGATRAAIDVELVDTLAIGPPHRAAQLGISNQASAALGEGVLVAERHEVAARAVAQKVALPAPIETDDRQTARHCLEKYQAEALVLAG